MGSSDGCGELPRGWLGHLELNAKTRFFWRHFQTDAKIEIGHGLWDLQMDVEIWLANVKTCFLLCCHDQVRVLAALGEEVTKLVEKIVQS